jgi:hypothetical protein
MEDLKNAILNFIIKNYELLSNKIELKEILEFIAIIIL